MIDEENEILDPVKRSESEKVLKAFIRVLRKGEEEGAFILMRDGEKYI